MVRNLLQYISDLHFLFILSDFGFELQFSKKYSYNCKGDYNLFVHSQHSQEMALKYHFNENFCMKPWITTANTVFISSAGSATLESAISYSELDITTENLNRAILIC